MEILLNLKDPQLKPIKVIINQPLAKLPLLPMLPSYRFPDLSSIIVVLYINML